MALYKLKVLSPLHIGSGEELTPMEYYWSGTEFGPLNKEKLFNEKEFSQKIEFLIENIKQGRRYIGDIISQDILRKNTLYLIDIKGMAKEIGKRNIFTFIKTGNRVFIPGSSIKGSILSAMFYHVLSKMDKKHLLETGIDNPKNFDRIKGEVLDKIVNDIYKKSIRKLEKSKIPESFYNWIMVSDTNLLNPQDVLILSFAQIVGSANRKFGTLMETVKEGSEFIFEIKRKEINMEIEEMLEKVDEFYRKVWKKDTSKTDPPDKKYLIRLGQGSTNYAVSLLILAEEKKIGIPARKPRTRKRIDGEKMMGWCLIEKLK